MDSIDQQQLNAIELEALARAISTDRLGTYLRYAGYNITRSLDLYIWNARIGEAFHIPIQAVEVGLRNCIHHGLSAQYGDGWWQNNDLMAILDADRHADLTTVFRRIRNRDLELQTGQVVAGLSFGFWVGMLDGKYNIRTAFPYLPAGRARKSVFAEVGKIATLRNRISHHEPLFERDLSSDMATITLVLDWICPTTSKWIKPNFRIHAVLQEKP
jgi:hypothetical protein